MTVPPSGADETGEANEVQGGRAPTVPGPAGDGGCVGPVGSEPDLTGWSELFVPLQILLAEHR